MSGDPSGNGGQRELARPSDETLDRQIREALTASGVVSAARLRTADEFRGLGRLALAFLQIENPDIRSDIISLLESIGTLESTTREVPRR